MCEFLMSSKSVSINYIPQIMKMDSCKISNWEVVHFNTTVGALDRINTPCLIFDNCLCQIYIKPVYNVTSIEHKKSMILPSESIETEESFHPYSLRTSLF